MNNYLCSREFNEFCLSRLNKELTAEYLYSNLNLLHAALGIVGEAQEVAEAYDAFSSSETLADASLLAEPASESNLVRNKKNIIKELGDVLFYLAIIKDDFQHTATIKEEGEGTVFHLQVYSIELAELIKKYVFQQRRDLYPQIAEKITKLFVCVRKIAASFDTGISEVEDACTEKLTARYPEKFTPEQSLHRTV